MGVLRACVALRRRWGAAGLALGAAGLALGALLLAAGGPAFVRTRLTLPVAPARLAHLLADYSYHPHSGSWVVEDESGNYTSWSYAVSYECGPRCAGRARVAVHEEHGQAGGEGPGRGRGSGRGAPRHGPAQVHRVLVAHRDCVRPPLLGWPQLCEEREVESVVKDDGRGGALLLEERRGHCGPLGMLGMLGAVGTAGGCGRALQAASDAHLRHLRNILALP